MHFLQDDTAGATAVAESTAKELMEEEERIQAKAAAKKAKKQRQKANKQQPSVSLSTAAGAAASEPEAITSLSAAPATELPLALNDMTDTSQASDALQEHLQDFTIGSDTAEDQTAAFLTQLFCCPLTQVSQLLTHCPSR